MARWLYPSLSLLDGCVRITAAAPCPVPQRGCAGGQPGGTKMPLLGFKLPPKERNSRGRTSETLLQGGRWKEASFSPSLPTALG